MHLVDFIIRIYHDAQSTEHRMLKHLCCCTGLITIEDINLINTRGWFYSRLLG